MFVTELSLTDFRNYETAALELTDGVTVFVGSNGQGKTNLVEAVEYLSTMSSHRVSSTAPLIRAGAESAVLRARVQAGRDDPRLITLELEVTTGRSNVARLNRAPLQRPRDLVGALRTVVFSPMDIAIVRGDPSDRRAWLDTMPGSEIPVLRQPFVPGDKLPLFAPGNAVGRHYLYDLGVDPDEQENRTGEPREAEMIELLRVALGELEAPVEHLERLGIA